MVVFVDPLPVSSPAVASVFLTIGFLPLVWIAFNANPHGRTSISRLAAKARKNAKLGQAKKRLRNLGAMGALGRAALAAAAQG